MVAKVVTGATRRGLSVYELTPCGHAARTQEGAEAPVDIADQSGINPPAQGLPLGARPINNEKELAEILKRSYKKNDQTGKDKLSTIKAFPASNIDKLLRGEIHRLEVVIEGIKTYLNHGDAEDSREQERLTLLLEELDYLYLHFPELRLENNRPYMLRVLHSAVTCHKRLTRLLIRIP